MVVQYALCIFRIAHKNNAIDLLTVPWEQCAECIYIL